MRLSRRSILVATGAALAGCRGARHGAGAERVPGVAIARIRRGAPDELEARGDVTADTLVEVASLSKPVFAYAVLAEASRGALDVDAPLARVAPGPYRHVRRGGVDAFDDPRLAQVTPRMLLAHRAGLPNWSRTEPLAFEHAPGARWRYSGEGYVLLQRALEARGEKLDAFVRRAALDPLGMRRATFDPRAGSPRGTGHDRAGAPVASSLDAEIAATSLVASAAEYARFARRLAEAPRGDAVVDAMLAPQAVVDSDRGIGWGTGIALCEPEWFFHWGVNPGFRALFVGSRRRGEAIVVLTDSDAGMELAADVVRSRFGDLPLLGFPMLYPPD